MGDGGNGSQVLSRLFLRMCRRNMRRSKAADSTGMDLTGSSLLMRSLILRRLLVREVLAADERNVGILLPPSCACVLVNAALALDRRVAVNLNYTLTSEVMNQFCLHPAGLRHVITSRRAMERFQLKLDAEMVYLEDLVAKVTLVDKLAAAIQARLVPVPILERRLRLTSVDPEDLLTIIFTSGATGEPKGVMLSHRNVAANIHSFDQVIQLRRTDVVVGILPIFHSFGYSTTMWTVLTLDPKGIYHFNPLEARQVGKLSRDHGGTMLIAAPTFLRAYLRRCEPEDFAKLEVVVAGAEQLPRDLADKFQERFGVRPVEGYGATELSPVVSCNVPPDRPVPGYGNREGTVGQPMPDIAAKVVDLETGEDLGPGRSGMLLVKGPNVMQGYLNEPQKTAEVMRGPWYVTGDIALIDDEGFIHITGRETRFSKIGGEMIPHIRVEAAIGQLLKLDPDEVRLAVTGVPHPTKGERLVVLHTGLDLPPERICRELGQAGLPPIWIPSPDSFKQVAEIPILGTGKLDLRRVKERARQEFPEAP
jgi:acyl-[acyl-carrier-protein]-phospholipid O-acyltransferase/long-chain-fatty-acid--[acyl-carrier-protein] ligase